MANRRERIEWIDLLRVIAISCVLLCHATEGVYPLEFVQIHPMILPLKLYIFGSFTLGRLGVPLFLMITGYLLLDREYQEQEIIAFEKKNWLHLFLCTELWYVIYEVFLCVYRGNALDAASLVRRLLFVEKSPFSHAWYLPMILGMYLLIPFAARAVRNVRLNLLFGPCLFFCLYAFLYPLAQLLLKQFGDNTSLALQMSMGYSGGVYGIYIFFGYFIKRGLMERIGNRCLLLAGILSYLLGAALQIAAYTWGKGYIIWYDSPFIFVSSVCFFVLVSRTGRGKGHKMVRTVSRYSFAVYLIHNLIRVPLLPAIRGTGIYMSVQVVLVWLITMGASLVLAALIARIPGAGKYLLYIIPEKARDRGPAIGSDRGKEEN